MNIALVSVADADLDAFLTMFDAYRRELDAYDPSGPDTQPLDRYRQALLDDPEGQELLFIEADGNRAGFLLAREFEDWPDASRRVVEIAECYVQPSSRRRGVARAAVEALLARERARGTVLVEAAVLQRNEQALQFWRALGFEVRAVQTARRP
jgi:ribosomal protein S18 acetylase RimI-like enzyme